MAKKSKHSRSGKGGTSKVDKLFKNGEPSRGFRNLPSGTYEGYVKPGSALIEPKSKDSEDYRAVIDLVVSEDGEYEGREQRARYDLSTDVGVNIFMGDLESMELGRPETLADAAEMLSESDGIPVSFWVSEPQDEYPPKVRINERLEGDASAAKADDDESEPDEPELTAKDIKKMSEDELAELAEDNDLDPDDYDTWDDLAKELIGLLID